MEAGEIRNSILNIQRQIREAYLCERYDQMKELNTQLSELSTCITDPEYAREIRRYQQNVDIIQQHSELYAEVIKQILCSTMEFDEYIIALKLLEERQNNELADRKYELALDTVTEILGVLDKIRDREKYDKYNELKEQIEANIQQQQELEAKYKRKLKEIEALKKGAMKLEEQLHLEEAKTTYQDVIQLAVVINDHLTIAFCDQRMAQIEIWEEEIQSSDLAKLEIPPFRLIRRERFDCLEAFAEEKVTKQRVADLVILGVRKKNIEIVTIVRAKLKGNAPYNQKGECFAIYVRKTLEW